jgi:hypothetical protein
MILSPVSIIGTPLLQELLVLMHSPLLKKPLATVLLLVIFLLTMSVPPVMPDTIVLVVLKLHVLMGNGLLLVKVVAD